MSAAKEERTQRSRRIWDGLELALRVSCVLLIVLQVMLVAVPAIGAWAAGPQSPPSFISINHAETTRTETAPRTATKGSKAFADKCCEMNKSIDEVRKELKDANETELTKFEKDVGDWITRRQADYESLLNRELTLVSIYTVLVAALTFMSIQRTRDDAKETLSNVSGQAKDTLDNLGGRAKDALGNLSSQIDVYEGRMNDRLDEINKRADEIFESFPEFREMYQRLRDILAEVSRTLNPERRLITVDSADEQNFSDLSPRDREMILHAEMVTAGLSASFAFKSSPRLSAKMAEIYKAFARFYYYYMSVLSSGKESENAFERSLLYVDKAAELAPTDLMVRRLRGSIRLARYDRLVGEGHSEPEVLERLLQRATDDLRAASAVAGEDNADAGAFYNLSLASYYAGDLNGAIAVLRQLMELRGRVSLVLWQKFMPDSFVNLACFLAIRAMRKKEAGRGDGSAGEEDLREAIDVLKAGIVEFRSDKLKEEGYSRLQQGLEREIEEGDLRTLPAEAKEDLLAMLREKR